MQKKLPSILLGGAVLAIVHTLLYILLAHFILQRSPAVLLVSCLSCFISPTAGVLAVWHYVEITQETIPGRQGASLGFMAGATAVILGNLLSGLLRWIGLIPDVRELVETGGPAFNPSWYLQVIVQVAVIAIYGLLGLIGGVLGAAFFKKRSAQTDASTESDPL
ncbi:hypothetical protein ABUL39_03185 [Rhodothermus marinus]|uniref:hypothetical protein n=1 Tax=Rhodothermus marinus TaxID=29549 RepID=UPI0037C656F3